MKYLRTVSTRRLLATDRRRRRRCRRRHGDRRRRRRHRAQSPAQAAGRRGPQRARRAPKVNRDLRADQLHQPPDRLLDHPGRRPDPAGRQRPPVAVRRRTAAARAAVRQRRRPGGRQPTARSGSTTRRRTPSTRARCRPTRHSARGQRRQDPVARLRSSRSEPADAAASTCRGAIPDRRRRPGRLHGARLAQARRRPARLGRSSPGTRPRRAAAVRDLRARQHDPGARAQGDRHLLRRGAGVGLHISPPAGAKVVQVATGRPGEPRPPARTHAPPARR